MSDLELRARALEWYAAWDAYDASLAHADINRMGLEKELSRTERRLAAVVRRLLAADAAAARAAEREQEATR
jgi:hypothetical protein